MSSNLSHIEAQIRNYIPVRPLGHPDNCDAGCCGAHSYLTALVNIAKAAPGLLEIAEQAMPDSYFQSDSRVNTAREALAALGLHP